MLYAVYTFMTPNLYQLARLGPHPCGFHAAKIQLLGVTLDGCSSRVVKSWGKKNKKKDKNKNNNLLPREPTTFIFRGYNPYFGGA